MNSDVRTRGVALAAASFEFLRVYEWSRLKASLKKNRSNKIAFNYLTFLIIPLNYNHPLLT